jgi:hypothetical protein
MRLSLKKNWQNKMTTKIKIYSLNTDDRKMINDTFNRLQAQNRLKFTTVATSFSYSVFVVWTIKDDIRKSRAIVNIRDLNALLVSNVYSVFSQSKIIDNLLECKYLSILDANVFFYQWRIHSEDVYKQTVVTHREQETFLMSIMSNRNSMTYVQRQMNILLNELRKFVRAYIDDIICRSKTFQEHLRHLKILFRIFLRKSITINSLKTFLDYQSVILLKQRVNALELIIVEKKLKAISLLKFSKNLIALKRYLRLTEYLRDKVYFFAKVFKSFQELKIKLLKNSSNESRRKRFINRTKIILIEKEMTSFLLLQENLTKTTLLIHFDKNKWLWIDLDEFKKFDFEIIVFHVTKEFSKEIWSTKDDIQLIMFLSRLLTSAEKNYWFIELEIVELIWVIKKIRHLIQSSEKSVIIQIDHVVIMNICKQISITSINSAMRMNLRLVRTSQFLSQFSNLKIRHKSEKYHLILDALSRLQSMNKKDLSDDHVELDELFVDHYCYNITLMKLNSEFRKRIIEEYIKNSVWKKIIQTIDQNAVLSENAAKLFFVREFDTVSRESDSYMTSSIDSSLNNQVLNQSEDKNLIYHVNRETEEKRLCISSECVSDILAIAHEQNQEHSRFGTCFEIISRFWYIRDLIKFLRFYIKHCSQCLQIQTRRHKSWENLQSIYSSSVFFHIITMNFVRSLPKIKEGIDCVLSVIDKFTKRVMLISEKFIFTVENWTIQLLEKSQRRDWDISKMIISDRDRKFLSDLWRTLFAKLSVFMLYFTAYHSQTNEASERTNQTLEIALRYYIQEMLDLTLWISALWKFQSIFNNTRFAVTEKISNELLYEITSNLSLDISSSNKTVDNHTQLRKEAQNVIDWTQMINKTHYDRRHSSLFLKMSEWVLLRLHHEYFVSESKDMIKKIFAQYVEFFKIIQRIERLVYRLNVSFDWKIHSVFFVAQLKLASDSIKDSFNRSRSTHSSSVIDIQNQYEIERLINKRVIRRDQNHSIEYLIRWLRYESEYDRWYNVKNLANAKDLIVDYEKKLINSFN